MTDNLSQELARINALDEKRLEWLPGYAIFANGEVWHMESKWRSGGPRFVRPQITSDGYYRVRCVLADGTVRRIMVHQLVCEAFNGPKPTAKHQVRHLDGSRTNNGCHNLAWGTVAENAQDRKLHGTERFAENMKKAGLKLRGRRKPLCKRGHDKEGKVNCPVCSRVANLAYYHRNKTLTTIRDALGGEK